MVREDWANARTLEARGLLGTILEEEVEFLTVDDDDDDDPTSTSILLLLPPSSPTSVPFCWTAFIPPSSSCPSSDDKDACWMKDKNEY